VLVDIGVDPQPAKDLNLVQMDAVVVNVTGVRYKNENRQAAKNTKMIPRRLRVLERF